MHELAPIRPISRIYLNNQTNDTDENNNFSQVSCRNIFFESHRQERSVFMHCCALQANNAARYGKALFDHRPRINRDRQFTHFINVIKIQDCTMIIQPYLFFAVGACWVSFVLAMLFLFTTDPKIPELENYRSAKYIMAFAYLLFCLISLFEILGKLKGIDRSSYKTSILIISVFHLYLFTHVNISLIELKYLSYRKLFYHLIPVIILSLLNLDNYTLHGDGKFTQIMHYSLLLFYAISVVCSAFIFFKHYRNYKKRFENYYTGNIADHLQWVFISYLGILLASPCIILFILLSTKIIALVPILVILFFTGYAINFLNYAHIFDHIEPFIKEEPKMLPKAAPLNYSQIENAIETWEKNKSFMQANITLNTLATQFSTNRTYLSQYINTVKQKTFNEWINSLRIEEAKKLIAANKKMTLEEISEIVGYTDKSYFSKCFQKYTGTTPKKWKKSLNQR